MTKRIQLAVAISAVILVAAVVTLIYTAGKKDSGSKVSINQKLPEASGAKKEAPAGELVSGFPETFAPVGGTITSSYNMTYKTANQYTANFTSSKSLKAEYDSYLSYLNTNKYHIVNKGLDKTSAHLYAQNSTGVVNIVLNQPSAKDPLAVTVSYIKNQ